MENQRRFQAFLLILNMRKILGETSYRIPAAIGRETGNGFC